MAEPEKKVMDVAKPEDAKTDIGGKPMIIGHKSMASDPMVRDQASSEENISPVNKTEVQVQPPSMSQKTIDPPTEATTREKVVNKSNESEPKNVEKDDKSKETVATDDATIDPNAEAMEREDRIRKILDSKEYRVNIKQARGAHKKLIWILFGALLLVIGALFYFVDTNKIDLGFDLPFSIFGEKEKVITPETVNEEALEESAKVEDSLEEVESPNYTAVSTELLGKISEQWGTYSVTDMIYRFSNYPQLELTSQKVAGAKTSVAIGHSSYCLLVDSSEWSPEINTTLGSKSPSADKCPSSTRTENGQKVYVFEYSADGAYKYKEVIIINSTLYELSERTDYESDYNLEAVDAEIKDGVVERIQSSLKTRTAEFLKIVK